MIYPRDSRWAHIFPEEEITMFLYYKNKARGDIFEVKGIRGQFS